MLSRSRFVALSFVLPLSLGALTMGMPACSIDDQGDVDLDPIAWVSPTPGAVITVGEPVQLTVKVNEPAANIVRFDVDGELLDTCDTTRGPDECRRGVLFRTTTTFHTAKLYELVATFPSNDGDRIATLSVEVRAPRGDGDAGTPDAGDAGATEPAPPVDRGFLDPDRELHNVFGGVSWSVKDQRVGVVNSPPESTTAVAACMKTYGVSIIKHADAFKVSRASVVATAITESNCTNPAGSSDGLSSGPMQVTGTTCASVVSGYTSAACKAKMHSDPDFSFMVGAQYMGGSYQVKQHEYDPPKIGAAYNAGSIRQSTANRWHMVVTGNHLERWVGAYNAYRAWEAMTGQAKAALAAQIASRPLGVFNGEHVAEMNELPRAAPVGQVYFVGDWDERDGFFVQFRDGAWHTD